MCVRIIPASTCHVGLIVPDLSLELVTPTLRLSWGIVLYYTAPTCCVSLIVPNLSLELVVPTLWLSWVAMPLGALGVQCRPGVQEGVTSFLLYWHAMPPKA